jgi:hypothetical protein
MTSNDVTDFIMKFSCHGGGRGIVQAIPRIYHSNKKYKFDQGLKQVSNKSYLGNCHFTRGLVVLAGGQMDGWMDGWMDGYLDLEVLRVVQNSQYV